MRGQPFGLLHGLGQGPVAVAGRRMRRARARWPTTLPVSMASSAPRRWSHSHRQDHNQELGCLVATHSGERAGVRSEPTAGLSTRQLQCQVLADIGYQNGGWSG